MQTNWEKVTKEHILLAIQEFDNSKEPYARSWNTFLLYNDIEYPAKHIRWLAFRIANKKEISKETYNGGAPTVNFFIERGFKMRYQGELITPPRNK